VCAVVQVARRERLLDTRAGVATAMLAPEVVFRRCGSSRRLFSGIRGCFSARCRGMPGEKHMK